MTTAPSNGTTPRRLILRSFQSPGDVVMLTAAVRDLHAACPGKFQTDVRTTADVIWKNNPHLTALQEGQPGVEVLDMHYPLIHQSNQRPYHFLHGYAQFLEQHLGVRIPVTQFRGDIHLSADEKQSLWADLGLPEHFWILVAGGKRDFTAKWWNPASYQTVVDHFRGKIQFVQCGEAGHWHLPLEGVINLVGKTDTRQFIRLMYHADGVLCPVTFAMHLAAAVETKPGCPPHRPCVVVAGGREPAHWEAYPHHQFLSTSGALPCCAEGGCWKSRCQLVGDGDAKDRHDVCDNPVQITPELRIPKCLDLITPEDVIRRIDLYYRGGALSLTNEKSAGHRVASAAPDPVPAAPPVKRTNVLIRFRHGLGDAVQLTAVLKHLQHYHPDWDVDVSALLGKHSAFPGLCRKVFVLDRDHIPACRKHEKVFDLDWHENRTDNADCPSTKVERCLREVFGLTPVPDLCSYTIQRSDLANEQARHYLQGICPAGPDATGRFPTVLIHYEGNTSSDRKNLPHDLVREVCDVILANGRVPVILDWDRRSPLPDGTRIHNPGTDHALWNGTGTGDAETLAALIEASSLLIGVDSGPLHVAAATTTPAIGVWTHHHPVHYLSAAENVTHLVPVNHEQLTAGPRALDYFRTHYRRRVSEDLEFDLPALAESCLTGEDFDAVVRKRPQKPLTTTAYDAHYYREHQRTGLDYLTFGDWQREYGRWLIETLGLKKKRVLDVGCACGSMLRGFGDAGAIVQGVDLNEHMIRLGREKWPDMKSLLHVCDAVNLHLFGDASWDALHSAQVAEHWKPELVPFILRELRRVAAPGSLFFCSLDTEEMFVRQGRRIEDEDPTHVCIRPMAWWHEQLEQAGWTVCTAEWAQRLREHPLSFLKRYDWDWFIARRSE